MTKLKFTLHYEDLPNTVTFGSSVAIDTETLGLNILRDRLCLVQLCDIDGNIHIVKFSGNTYNAPNLIKLLQDESITKIFHFARFDVAKLMISFGIPRINSIFCTKIASKLVRTYSSAHGLKTIVKEFLGIEMDKESQSTNWSSDVLSEKQLQYAAYDVIYLHKLRDILIKMLQETSRADLADRCFDFLCSSVSIMDINGFSVEEIFIH